MACHHKWNQVGKFTIAKEIPDRTLWRIQQVRWQDHWNDTIYMVKICKNCFDTYIRELGKNWKLLTIADVKSQNISTNDLSLQILWSTIRSGTIIKEWPPVLIIKCDIQKRLHNENGSSVEWPGHFKQYSWHGITIPSDWIEHKTAIKSSEFLSERNVERRKVLYEILGRESVLRMLNAILIDDKNNPEKYPKLYEAFDPSIGTFKMIQVKEPTTGDIYCHFCDIRCKTAREAVASLWEMSVKEFNPENLKV